MTPPTAVLPPPAPAEPGTTFRYRSTGMPWLLDYYRPDGSMRLSASFYGPDNYARVYVTPEELLEHYDQEPA